MSKLAEAGPDGSATANRAWAREYDMQAYAARLGPLLDGVLA